MYFRVFAALMSLLPRLVWAEETFLRKDDKNDNKLSIYFCDTMARTKLGFMLPEIRDGALTQNVDFHFYKYLYSKAWLRNFALCATLNDG